MSHVSATRAVFEEIIDLINQGEIDKAIGLCEETLERFPRDVNILGLLGAIYLKQNRAEDAEQYLRRTIELAPSFAKPHEDLGILLLDRDRPDEAVEMLQKATRLDPKSETAIFNLGKALVKIGKGQEADQAFEKAFELSPTRKLVSEAARLHADGKFAEAERIYRKVLDAEPNNVSALRMLGMIAASAQHVEDAERLLRKAVRIAPDYFTAQVDLGRIYKEQDRYEDAIACFRKAIELEPGNPKPWFLLASTLAPAALTFDAVDAYRRCIELRPEHAGAWLGLGHTLKTVGNLGEGIEAYRRCIDLKPDNGETYWSLANLKTFRFSDAELVQMEERLASGKINHDSSEVNFMFALAKAYEDREDYDTAWDWYRRGNEKQRELVSYDPVHLQVTHDAILNTFDAALFDRLGGQGCDDPSPIFILGLPRSGSTLIEQILASHSMVEGTSELPYLARVASSLNRNRADGVNYPQAVLELGPDNLRQLGEDYLGYAQMHRTEGKPRFIDKMPNNFPNVGLAHLILPNVKIIDARRHPLDACLGNYRQLYAKGQNFSYDLVELGEYYLEYQRLMDAWQERIPGSIL
ncbi:MAG: tetratricopeptide repeat-containing sulfotransferase family protein, partial [Planctomycetota bacterium]